MIFSFLKQIGSFKKVEHIKALFEKTYDGIPSPVFLIRKKDLVCANQFVKDKIYDPALLKELFKENQLFVSLTTRGSERTSADNKNSLCGINIPEFSNIPFHKRVSSFFFYEEYQVISLAHVNTNQATLTDLRNSFLNLFYTSINSHFLLDNKNVITEVNKTAEHLLEKERRDLIGKSIFEYIDRETVLEIRKSSSEQKGEQAPVMEGHTHLNFKATPVEVSGANIHLFGQEVFYLTLRDISQRKEFQEKLLIEKAYMEKLFDSAPEAIVTISTDGKIDRINQAFTNTFGFTEEESIGKSIKDLLSKPDQNLEIDEINSDILNKGIKYTESVRYTKKGRAIDVSILGTPIIIDGKVTGIYGIYRDISKTKKIERQLRKAKERAEESDRLKTAFLANMSHEIRTPMNAIIGFSNLLDAETDADERKEYLKLIKSSSDSLLNLIDDIIDISKIEAGQLKLYKQQCSINKVIYELYSLYSEVNRKANGDNVQLILGRKVHAENIVVLCDPNRLKQIISNLISNAIKFSTQGNIYIDFSIEDHKLRISVKDQGIGIPEEQQEIIFDRFRQVDNSSDRKYGGTGLGLAISKNLAHLLGGDLHVESEEGVGSEFYLELPYQSSGRNSAPVSSNGQKKIFDWKNKKILIAEDDLANFMFLERAIRKTKAEVVRAEDGAKAIELIKEKSDYFDLILMDIQMPVMNGYDALKGIKDVSPATPVIAQTANALSGEKEKCLSLGFKDYLTKPIKPNKLLEVMDKHWKN